MIATAGHGEDTGVMAVWQPEPFECEPDEALLHGAVDAELAVDPDELDAEALGARLLRLRRERDRLEIAIARADAAFERSRAYAILDPTCAKAAQWLAAQLQIPIGAARDAFRFARRLRLLPAVVAAVVAGSITLWHARKLTRACSHHRRAARMKTDQDRMVEWAGEFDAPEFERLVRRWTEIHFGDELDAQAARADERRELHVSRTYDHSPQVKGQLHPVWGTLFETELGRIDHELFRHDWTRAKAEHGDSTRPEHLWRSPAQRRHDALLVMAQRSAMVGPGAEAKRPLLSVLVDWPTLEGKVCELENGVSITAGQAADVLRIADVERAVWGPDDRISVSHKARVFRGAERRAVELRDRFCTAPGCSEPADRSDVDHILPYEEGGPTEQRNGQLRCPANHPNRRARPEDRPLPWELVEEEWGEWADWGEHDHDTLAAEFAQWHDHARRHAPERCDAPERRDGAHERPPDTG